jgi:hypothetical protein
VPENEEREGVSHDRWLRRQAIQIAAQLPENRSDAAGILLYARELISGFLSGADSRQSVDSVADYRLSERRFSKSGS